MEPVLTIKGVSKKLGNRQVIDNISFSVNSGEVYGFLGPNGAGKTTTIKMILGLLSVDNGEIIINGYNVAKNFEEAMTNIGGIIENPEMYGYIDVITNLRMYARMHEGVTEQRIKEVVELVGMSLRVNEKFRRYSLGMKQRLGLAQTILHKPKILILDEPTNGLDPAGIHELRDILKNLAHKEGVAVLVSSHLLSEMEIMCDRVGIINNGKFLGDKSIKELLNDANQNGSVFRYKLKNIEGAQLALTEVSEKIMLVTEDYIDIAVDEIDLPLINELLYKNSIPIFGLAPVENTLEEAFLSITGGGNNIA